MELDENQDQLCAEEDETEQKVVVYLKVKIPSEEQMMMRYWKNLCGSVTLSDEASEAFKGANSLFHDSDVCSLLEKYPEERAFVSEVEKLRVPDGNFIITYLAKEGLDEQLQWLTCSFFFCLDIEGAIEACIENDDLECFKILFLRYEGSCDDAAVKLALRAHSYDCLLWMFECTAADSDARAAVVKHIFEAEDVEALWYIYKNCDSVLDVDSFYNLAWMYNVSPSSDLFFVRLLERFQSYEYVVLPSLNESHAIMEFLYTCRVAPAIWVLRHYQLDLVGNDFHLLREIERRNYQQCSVLQAERAPMCFGQLWMHLLARTGSHFGSAYGILSDRSRFAILRFVSRSSQFRSLCLWPRLLQSLDNPEAIIFFHVMKQLQGSLNPSVASALPFLSATQDQPFRWYRDRDTYVQQIYPFLYELFKTQIKRMQQ
jgi:hypothetical protein